MNPGRSVSLTLPSSHSQRAELAERELEMAKEEGSLTPHRSSSQSHLQAAELEAQLHAKDQEILQLFEANQHLQGELTELKSYLSEQLAIHKGQLAEKSGEVEQLRQELAAQQDYAELKRELRYGHGGTWEFTECVTRATYPYYVTMTTHCSW